MSMGADATARPKAARKGLVSAGLEVADGSMTVDALRRSLTSKSGVISLAAGEELISKCANRYSLVTNLTCARHLVRLQFVPLPW